MTKAKFGKVTDYIPDSQNANAGSERGLQMIEDSLRSHGAGRSIVVDRNGKIISGNKTLEGAINIGIEDVVEVETDGTALIVHRRKDMDLDNPNTRWYAYRDNRTAEASLTWDTAQMMIDREKELIPPGAFTPDEMDQHMSRVENPPAPTGVVGLLRHMQDAAYGSGYRFALELVLKNPGSTVLIWKASLYATDRKKSLVGMGKTPRYALKDLYARLGEIGNE